MSKTLKPRISGLPAPVFSSDCASWCSDPEQKYTCVYFSPLESLLNKSIALWLRFLSCSLSVTLFTSIKSSRRSVHSYNLHYLWNGYVQLFSYVLSIPSHSSAIPFPISSFPPLHPSPLIPFPFPLPFFPLPSSLIIFYLSSLHLLFSLFSLPPFLYQSHIKPSFPYSFYPPLSTQPTSQPFPAQPLPYIYATLQFILP